MTLNKDGWFVKYWLWWGCFSDMTYNRKYNPDYWRYEGSDICSIGRTAFIWAPIKTAICAAAAAAAIGLLYLLGWAIIFETMEILIVVGSIIGLIAAVIAIVWGIPAAFHYVMDSEPVQTFSEWAEAKHGKFCKKVDTK